jgi:D-beta-D-heptose 7-phosphate kinase/D-beta-D-heptose 1-phosphate adenosyltransferase
MGYTAGNIQWIHKHIKQMKHNYKQDDFIELCKKVSEFNNEKIAAVSGGFDPCTNVHSRMIKDSSKYGSVIVILNSDEWLMRKKGYIFMPFEERKEILLNQKNVIDVIKAKDDDNTVCSSLKEILPNFFCNGGDRKPDTTPEVILCNELGIELIWGAGGTEKVQSSSFLVKNAVKNISNLNR